MRVLEAAYELESTHEEWLKNVAEAVRPHGSEAWLDATQATRIFHVRRGAAPDFQRLARVLTGQSVGLVLSGGGARAYAHVGAIKALRERNVPSPEIIKNMETVLKGKWTADPGAPADAQKPRR